MFVDGDWHDFAVDRITNPVLGSKNYAEKEGLPFVIWWTPFTGEKGRIKKCMVGQCYFSQDQTLYSHHLSQAFMFYGTDLKPNDLPLPRKGTKNSLKIEF